MGVVSFNRVKIYFICRVLQVLDKVWNISNIYKDHVFVQADLISLLESLGVRIAAIRELLLVDDFEFKFNMPMSINRTLVGIPYEQFREIFSITIIPGIGQ